MRRNSVILALGVCLVLTGTLSDRPTRDVASGAPVPASNLAMAARLAELAKRVDRDSVRYRNDLFVRLLLHQRSRAKTPVSPTFHFTLSNELLRAGRPQEALDALAQAEAAIVEVGAEMTDADRMRLAHRQAIAFMRMGEQSNCIEHHTTDSCLLPIRKGGVHRNQEGSRNAIAVYTRILEQTPDDLGARWLLNIAYMTVGEYPGGVPERWRIAEESWASESTMPRMTDVARETGVDHPLLSGGVVLEDLDGDGFLDLMTTSWGVSDQMRFFRNTGAGTFEDRTEEAGLIGLTGGLNLIHADYDNDGRPDVLVLRGAWMGRAGKHPNSLLRNLGGGKFEDVTRRAGLWAEHPTQTAAWGDFDNDGLLDLFVGRESRNDRRPCALFRNNGDGTFTDVASRVGLDHVGFVKAAVWGDVDNDGDLDLYLSQMFQPNVLYRNLGKVKVGEREVVRFEDVTETAGVAEPVRSFPSWFFDFDNDGWLDLVVGSFSDFGSSALDSVVRDHLDLPTDAERARLYRNRGDGTFEDASKAANLDHVLLAMGANFGDLDNDGWLDAYFGTGEPAMSTLVPNRMFRNLGGERFADVTTVAGLGHLQKGHGIAFGDVDGDGDQDVYAVLGGAYSGDVYQNALFENPGVEGNRWLTLRFRGSKANRMAHGARVRVILEEAGGGTRTLHRVVGTGGSFGSSSLQLEVGVGTAARVRAVEVEWPGSGKTSRFTGVPLERVVLLDEAKDAPTVLAPKAFELARKRP